MTSDDTARMKQGSETSEARTRQLVRRVGELSQLLKSQQDILKQRGMNLPSAALQTLTSLNPMLENLAKHTLMSGIELRHLHALADTTALVNSSLETGEVLDRVMDTVIHLTGAERGFIMLKNRQTGELEFVVTRGLDQAQIIQNNFMVSQTIANNVARSGLPELTSNASSDPRFQANESIVSNALRSIIAVPLKARGEVIGVVYCDNRFLVGVFNQHDLDLVTDFANQAAVAIENAQLFDAARARLAEVKATSDMIASILESIASGVIAVDQDGIINTCNLLAESILGQTEDDTLGKLIYDVLPPGLSDSFYKCLEFVRDTGEPEMMTLEPVIPGQGQRFWNIIVSPLRDHNGQMQGMTIVLDDLTESRQRQQQVQEASRYLPPALVRNIRSFDVGDVGGEERLITILSADVRGFSTFSERLDPQDVMRIINQYLSLASDAINLYEGVVDKFMGDAVTGLFNTQLHPQPDHSVRAVRAAMNLMYDLRALHEILPASQHLYYGVGIHTGTAVLGNVGSPDRKEFAAIGEAAEISKILEGNAQPGEIIISEATFQAVEEYFECAPFVPDKTKGRSDLTIAYKVIKRKHITAPLTLDDF
jgi:adenylate cyclase